MLVGQWVQMHLRAKVNIRIELFFFLKKRKEVQASCSLSKEKC
jgi:hypothetical protein